LIVCHKNIFHGEYHFSILKGEKLSMVTSRLKKLAKMIIDPQYKRQQLEDRRLLDFKRYTSTQTCLSNKSLDIVDAASFLFMRKEVFEQQIYRFKSKTPSPKIIDGGANIGLSVIYFKTLYPNSIITAFEPDSSVFKVLENNVRNFELGNVTLLQKALWKEERVLEFMAEGADGGRVVELENSRSIVKVDAIRLRPYLEEHVDFLKLDIEGAETEVIEDCQDLLKNVDNLFVEYHSFANQAQTLDRLVGILAKAGFRLHIHPPVTSPQPFYERNVHMGMDMQLNIFAFRD
jgi:FkbM family methyltransferase